MPFLTAEITVAQNDLGAWDDFVSSFKKASLGSRLGIGSGRGSWQLEGRAKTAESSTGRAVHPWIPAGTAVALDGTGTAQRYAFHDPRGEGPTVRPRVLDRTGGRSAANIPEPKARLGQQAGRRGATQLLRGDHSHAGTAHALEGRLVLWPSETALAVLERDGTAPVTTGRQDDRRSNLASCESGRIAAWIGSACARRNAGRGIATRQNPLPQTGKRSS